MDSDRDISSDHEESGNEPRKDISRHMSESSIAATEEDDDDVERKIDLGPQFTLKEQLEKDKVHLFFLLLSTFFFDPSHVCHLYIC